MSPQISFSGGANIGWVNASWPFAKLTADMGELNLRVTLVGKYRFAPEQVIAIEEYSGPLGLSRGLSIKHNVPTYPKKIIFWTMGKPAEALQQIQASGFTAKGTPLLVEQEKTVPGTPLRWPALIVLVVLWNLCFLVDFATGGSPAKPGLFSLLAAFTFFLGSLAIRRSEFLERIFIKPGRSLDEVKFALNLLTALSGFFTAVMLLGLVFQGR